MGWRLLLFTSVYSELKVTLAVSIVEGEREFEVINGVLWVLSLWFLRWPGQGVILTQTYLLMDFLEAVCVQVTHINKE